MRGKQLTLARARAGEFRSMESVGQFLDYYSGFEFLKPTPVKDFYFFKVPSLTPRVLRF